MTDELKMIFKEIIYHIDDVGFQTDGIGYVFKNEQDKQKLEQELAKLKCKDAKDTTEEDSIF